MNNHKRFLEVNRQINMLLKAADRVPSGTPEKSALLARANEMLNIMTSCNRAMREEQQIRYTTRGDFSHLPAAGMGFYRG